MLLVVGALTLRLIDLDARGFHHDEAQIAYFSWVLETRGGYKYDPVLHGPLIYHATALAQIVFGDSDFSSRLVPALAGTALCAIPFALREQLGRGAMLIAGLLLALAPTALFYTRFGREDAMAAALTLGLLATLIRLLDRPSRWHPLIGGTLLALAFAQKESTYITVALLAPAAVLVVARDGGLRSALRGLGFDAWMLGVAAFAAVYCALFSSLFTHPAGIWDGLYEGPKYWLSQHEVNRGGEPPGFYAVVLLLGEPLIVGLAVAGAVHAIRTRSRALCLITWFAVTSFAAYSFAGERFAWLALHPLVPMALLAGAGADRLRHVRRLPVRAVALAAIAAGAAYLGYATFQVNAAHPGSPRELLSSVESPRDVKRVADAVLRLPRDAKVEIDSAEGGGFPWAWYLRHRAVGFIDMTQADYRPRADALIAGPAASIRFGRDLRGYTPCPFRFRLFWLRDYGELTPAAALDWMLGRDPWNATGGQPGALYLRSRPCPSL